MKTLVKSPSLSLYLSNGGDWIIIVLNVEGKAEYSIWVSYAEIYNQYIYDLLEEPPSVLEENQGQSRKKLKLKVLFLLPLMAFIPESKLKMQHSKLKTKFKFKYKFKTIGNDCFIPGLIEVRVRNLEEAYLVLRKGQKNRQVFSTLLNGQSSRSHGVFNIKLIKLPIVNGEVIEDPSVIRATRFSIVDLAGSERYTKTKNTGDRLREAGNINKSLMCLVRCMEVLRNNQANAHRKVFKLFLPPFSLPPDLWSHE